MKDTKTLREELEQKCAELKPIEDDWDEFLKHFKNQNIDEEAEYISNNFKFMLHVLDKYQNKFAEESRYQKLLKEIVDIQKELNKSRLTNKVDTPILYLSAHGGTSLVTSRIRKWISHIRNDDEQYGIDENAFYCLRGQLQDEKEYILPFDWFTINIFEHQKGHTRVPLRFPLQSLQEKKEAEVTTEQKREIFIEGKEQFLINHNRNEYQRLQYSKNQYSTLAKIEMKTTCAIDSQLSMKDIEYWISAFEKWFLECGMALPSITNEQINPEKQFRDSAFKKGELKKIVDKFAKRHNLKTGDTVNSQLIKNWIEEIKYTYNKSVSDGSIRTILSRLGYSEESRNYH